MIQISNDQLTLIAKQTHADFVLRVADILQNEYPELVEPFSQRELLDHIGLAFEEAQGFHIEIEIDVYKYVVLTLRQGLSFLQSIDFAHKLDWLKSPFVPAVKKIDEIEHILLSREDNTPLQSENDNDSA